MVGTKLGQELHTRIATIEIVEHIRVDAFVGPVDFRRNAHQQHAHLVLPEIGALAQQFERQSRIERFGCRAKLVLRDTLGITQYPLIGGRLDLHGTLDLRQQLRHLLVRHTQRRSVGAQQLASELRLASYRPLQHTCQWLHAQREMADCKLRWS
ncbi:hypothetical protein V1279_007583 [Bradyrhizobium sp. AZCC 1610]